MKIRFSAPFIKALPVCLCLAFTPALGFAQSASACSPPDNSWNTGSYKVMTNYWNQSTCPGTECVTLNTSNGNFGVTEMTASCSSVAAYPAIYYGCHYGNCSSGTNLPMQVSKLQCVLSNWTITTPSSGTWDAAYDIWFCTGGAGSCTGGYDGAELMIWVDYLTASPLGTRIANNVSLGGKTWNVWEGRITSTTSWNVISYEAATKFDTVSNLDILSFINDAVSRGYINTAWYLHAIEAGIEITKPGAPFTSSGFSVTVNSGCGTPVPTATPTTTQCVQLFNGCNSATENGTWAGGNATRTFIAGSAAPAGANTEGATLMKVACGATTAVWNNGLFNLSGFSPDPLTGGIQLTVDVYVDAGVTALWGSYHSLSLVADAPASSLYSVAISSSNPTLNFGEQHLTFNLDYPASITSSMLLSNLYFVLNAQSPVTAGNFYVDNIRLLQSCGLPTATPTATRTSTPCASLFNGCETLADNGTWDGANATRSIVTSSGAPAGMPSQGTGCMKVQVTTPNGYNNAIFNLSGFTPTDFYGTTRISMDIDADASLIASGYNQLLLFADSSPNNLFFQGLSSSVPSVAAGKQTLTWTIDNQNPGGGASSITSGMPITKLYFVYNTAVSTNLGNFYVDNIQLLHDGCVITHTPVPTATPTRTFTITPSFTATNTITATRTNTSSPTPSLTPSRTATLTTTNTPASTATNTPANTSTSTATNSLTATRTNTPTLTLTNTATSTATNTVANTATFTLTSTRTNTQTLTPISTATSTATNTLTPTPTNTPANTSTATNTATNTATLTRTNTLANTATPTATSTNTPANTATATSTTTNTATNTATLTRTNTPANTSTNTATNTYTNTAANTSTFTATPTRTNTLANTATSTSTGTSTDTSTATSTLTNTATVTPTRTATFTATSTATNSATSTATRTNTFTVTDTATITSTPTNTQTGTQPPTSTPTNTATKTDTFTATGTNTPTSTPTDTSTATKTATHTPTLTPSNTATSTLTNTLTFTPTSTATSTATRTSTLTPSNTATSTSTATNTPANTATSTATSTATKTDTSTATFTPTVTDTATITSSPTNTQTGTQPPTDTPTDSTTPTPSATASLTASATPSPTPTDTFTNTATKTDTSSATSTTTFTPTSTPTNSSTFTLTFTPTWTLTNAGPTWTSTNTRTITATATASNTATLTPTATEVLVTASSNPPASSTQLPGATEVPAAQVQFTTGSSLPVTLTQLSVSVTGSGNPGGISQLTLLENGNQVGTATVSGNTATFTLANNNTLSSSAGATYTVQANFNGSASGTYVFNVSGAQGTNGQPLQFTGLPSTATTTVTVAAATATPTMTAGVTTLNSATPTATPKPVTTVIVGPNPATGTSVHVYVPLTAPAEVRVEIFTIAFRKVLDETFYNVQPGSPIPLELRDQKGTGLADGVYYVVVTANGRRSVVKLLVVH